MLVYLVWKTCMLTNEETGRLFGITYSAVSHILSSMRTKVQKDSEIHAYLFTMQDVTITHPLTHLNAMEELNKRNNLIIIHDVSEVAGAIALTLKVMDYPRVYILK